MTTTNHSNQGNGVVGIGRQEEINEDHDESLLSERRCSDHSPYVCERLFGCDHRTMLVMVNPHSGKGKAMKIFEKHLKPYLVKSKQNYELFVTEINKRASDKISSMTTKELTKLRSIVLVSGDGLMYEVVNAIMNRSDYKDHLTLPLSIVPGGSGNGLAYTLIRQRHPDMKDHKEAIELCCQQAVQPAITQSNLVKVTTGQADNPRTYWSFLSIGWGLLADIDIESEWLRKLGDLRFGIYGIFKSITSTTYKGTLSYKKAQVECNGTKNAITKQDWVQLDGPFSCIYGVNQRHISNSCEFAPRSTMTDQLIYLTIVRYSMNLKQTIEFLLAIGNGSHEQLPYVQVIPVTAFKFKPLEPSKVVVDGEVIPWTVDDGEVCVEMTDERLTFQWNIDEILYRI